MKIRLLLVLLSASLSLTAQLDSIKLTVDTTNITYEWKGSSEPVGRFDIGGGVQVNSIGLMGTSAGPMFTARANSRYGRIAGVFTMSYNFNNTYDYYYPSWDYNTSEYLISKVRYNFLKLSLAMQVPLFNRTNKRGFALSSIIGLSYYNGLGSGRYISFLDKPNPPVIYPDDIKFVNPSTKFNFNNHNLSMISFDIMLSATYTFKKFQVFVDGGIIAVGQLNRTYRTDSESSAAFFVGYYNRFQRFPLNINAGLRYCLYYPWQVKPPKRVITE